MTRVNERLSGSDFCEKAFEDVLPVSIFKLYHAAIATYGIFEICPKQIQFREQ
jgi:hypothetical protein